MSFYSKNKDKKIVVIPVNTHFDTIVDECIDCVDKPLVSANSIHGQWIKKMLENNSIEEIDTKIQDYLKRKGVQSVRDEERLRGNQNEYPIGTISVVKNSNNVDFFLLALTKFNKNNNAQCSDDEFIYTIRNLIDFYNKIGQRYTLYLPLLGTSYSRIKYSHQESLEKIITLCKLEKSKIFGEIKIVIYNKDKNKVSLWQ